MITDNNRSETLKFIVQCYRKKKERKMPVWETIDRIQLIVSENNNLYL